MGHLFVQTSADFVDFHFLRLFLWVIRMSSAPFEMGPAVKVSPLIKTARWGLLIAGIAYGWRRFNVLKGQEDEIAAYEARMKPIWDAEKAAAAAKANREQLIILAKEVGQKVPDNF